MHYIVHHIVHQNRRKLTEIKLAFSYMGSHISLSLPFPYYTPGVYIKFTILLLWKMPGMRWCSVVIYKSQMIVLYIHK
jgi:hypothetical protein